MDMAMINGLTSILIDINADINFANEAARKLNELRESTRVLALKDSQKIRDYIKNVENVENLNDLNLKFDNLIVENILDLNVACCLCVRNCAPYLNKIFLN
jgi:hypothetical protein